MDGAIPLSLKKNWLDVMTECIRLSENKVDSISCAVQRLTVLPVKNSHEGTWFVARGRYTAVRARSCLTQTTVLSLGLARRDPLVLFIYKVNVFVCN